MIWCRLSPVIWSRSEKIVLYNLINHLWPKVVSWWKAEKVMYLMESPLPIAAILLESQDLSMECQLMRALSWWEATKIIKFLMMSHHKAQHSWPKPFKIKSSMIKVRKGAWWGRVVTLKSKGKMIVTRIK